MMKTFKNLKLKENLKSSVCRVIKRVKINRKINDCEKPSRKKQPENNSKVALRGECEREKYST